jgi:UDP-3-O-[3-hydroxymyristoyl] glucosamine N-acyltransferase
MTISPLAYIDPSAVLGADCEIGHFAVILAGAMLGDRVSVGPHAIVGKPPVGHRTLARPPQDFDTRTVVESDATIDAHAVVYRGATVRADALVGDHASVREGAVVGRSCCVGRHASISHDVFMDDHSRVMDHCCIAGGATIGSGSFIAPGVMFANDGVVEGIRSYTFSAATYAPVHCGADVVVGMNATILAGVTLGARSTVAAHALVSRDVAPGQFVIGVPAKVRPPVAEIDVAERRIAGWGLPRPADHHAV